ncbi:MAG: ribonuclease T [Chromatiales bacterium]|nr:ribonuclease T [Chromatiales bacterium]
MNQTPPMATRFRGYLPVVVDVETGGFDPRTDALLEVAAVLVDFDADGILRPVETLAEHVLPFAGANLDPRALEFNGITDPWHPFRGAVEESEALSRLFAPIRRAVKASGCSRAILVGHNPQLDLGSINAAAERTGLRHNPFHPFSSFDTATLAGLAYGQTVLARAVKAAGIAWDANEAHSAIYDAEITAALFCAIVNRWDSWERKL